MAHFTITNQQQLARPPTGHPIEAPLYLVIEVSRKDHWFGLIAPRGPDGPGSSRVSVGSLRSWSHFAAGHGRTRGQWRAMRHGIDGIDGNAGTVESISYRIDWRRESSNPTPSAKPQSFAFNKLAGVVGSRRAMRLFSPSNFSCSFLKPAWAVATWVPFPPFDHPVPRTLGGHQPGGTQVCCADASVRSARFHHRRKARPL